MPFSKKHSKSTLTKNAKGVISLVALLLAIGFLLYQLFSSVLYALSQSYWIGFRSICAALFPLTVAIYLGYLASVQVPRRESRAPIINNYIVFLLWTMLLIGIDGSNDFLRFPLEELLYGTTIAVMIWRYRSSFRSLLACCYGVISGSLAAVILLGINPAAL